VSKRPKETRFLLSEHIKMVKARSMCDAISVSASGNRRLGTSSWVRDANVSAAAKACLSTSFLRVSKKYIEIGFQF
jgi:hypothetical protein